MIGHGNPIFSQNRRDQQWPLNHAGDTPAEIVDVAQRFLRDCVIGYARLLLGLGSVYFAVAAGWKWIKSGYVQDPPAKNILYHLRVIPPVSFY